jgi:dTDP-4-dehydrorhamnose 3,5-epimerase
MESQLIAQHGAEAMRPKVIAQDSGRRFVIVPRPTPSTGHMITDPNSKNLLPGVEIESLVQWPDDRGCFSELFRFGSTGVARDFVSTADSKIQVSITISYPGVIKAIHYHLKQTDLWIPVRGMLQVFLSDLREDSPMCGEINTVVIGSQRPWKLRIPPGVAHGYKVIGTESAQLVYATNRFYDPQDERRIDYDDPGINYDWVGRPR